MTILIFGGDGQVGQALRRVFKDQAGQTNIFFQNRQTCDLANLNSLERCLDYHRPHTIINASAYTAVDQAESESDLAYKINAEAVKLMASHTAKQSNGLFIHYSTDYVFSGEKKDSYLESDLPNPQSVYGKSKLAGELAIQEVFNTISLAPTQMVSGSENSGPLFYIFRTTWVYGEGLNFIRTMLKLAQQRDELRIVADQLGAPTSADFLAQLAKEFIHIKPPSGLYHASPKGYTSWHGLAHYVINWMQQYKPAYQAIVKQIYPIFTEDYPLPARRPKNSCLSTQKLQLVLGQFHSQLKINDWQSDLGVYLKQLTLK